MASRLERLERELGMRICPLCKGKGKHVVSYKHEGEPVPVVEGCPQCGAGVHIIVNYREMPPPRRALRARLRWMGGPMNLHRRILSLEAVHTHVLHACPLCGGVDPDNPGYVISHDDRPLPRCPGCSAELDDKGRALPAIYKRVILPCRDLL